MSRLFIRMFILLLTLLLGIPGAQAQPLAPSFCASDGQPRPLLLVERFINADCDSCWHDPATPKASAGHAVLDWVVPNDAGSKGEDAPLTAVASRDGLSRLQALGKSLPAQTLASNSIVKKRQGATLRVAHGLPLSGYLGTSIEFKAGPATTRAQALTAWLVLVESLPPGTEGSPVERNLVRNSVQIGLQPNKFGRKQLLNKERFFESRVMSIANGVNPERLRVIGWIEDQAGQVVVAAQSRCQVPS